MIFYCPLQSKCVLTDSSSACVLTTQYIQHRQELLTSGTVWQAQWRWQRSGSSKAVQPDGTPPTTLVQCLTGMRWWMSAVLTCDEVIKRSKRALDLKGEQWTLAEKMVYALRILLGCPCPMVVWNVYEYASTSSISSLPPWICIAHVGCLIGTKIYI